jgi:hypothetical protein
MAISKDEAAQALQDIDTVQQRTQTMLGYRNAAPYCLLWGCIRLVANLTTEFLPGMERSIWNLLTPLGIIASIWLAIYQSKQRSCNSPATRSCFTQWRWAAAWLVITGFITATLTILAPHNGHQINAFISLFWAFLYALIGLWAGGRILTIGVLSAVTVLIGYFAISNHFYLWMALAVDSLLILGSFWLRKV